MSLKPSSQISNPLRAMLIFTSALLATIGTGQKLTGQELLPPLNAIPFQVASDESATVAPQELAGLGAPNGEFQPEEFAPVDDEDLELLTRGPLHEAFAVSPSDEPLPGAIVQRRPPADVNEVPPEYEAVDGDESESIWIPGYWAWDEDREDYIWVSGAWRVSPPDRNWIPGYWHETEDGHQWISGFWAPAEVEQLSYVEPPPASLENGPSIPAPSEQHFWIPGNWVYQTNSYSWNAGRWCAHREDRVWVPAHYVYTPSGCIYVNGYWDYQLPLRGQLYAPVYSQRPVVAYRPRCEIRVGNLFMHLFVSRRHRHYFFGDYYDVRYRNRGCFPLHNFRYAARRYDPLYSYYRTHFALQGIDCRARLSGWHNYYTRHVHHRPPRTWSGYTSFGVHLASHPHLSRTVLARAPRYTNININIGRSRSLTHGHHNPPPRHLAGSYYHHHSRHEHLRDLARQRRRLEQKNAELVAASFRGQRRVNTRVEKLTIPKEFRTTMPRNSFTRPPKHRHDDAIVDASSLGRRGRDKDGPSRQRDRDHNTDRLTRDGRPDRHREDRVTGNGRFRDSFDGQTRGDRPDASRRPGRGGRGESTQRGRRDGGADKIAGGNRSDSRSEAVRKRDQQLNGLSYRDVVNAERGNTRSTIGSAGPANRRVTQKDLKAQSRSRDKQAKLNVERELKRGPSRPDGRSVASDNPPKVRPSQNEPTIIRGNNEIDNSISRRLEELRQRTRQPVTSKANKTPKPNSIVDVTPRTRTPQKALPSDTNSRKSRTPKSAPSPPRSIVGPNTNNRVVSESKPSRSKSSKQSRVKTPKPSKKTKNNVVRVPNPAPRTVTSRTVTNSPRQVTQPRQIQPQPTRQSRQVQSRQNQTRQIQPRSIPQRTIVESKPARTPKPSKTPKSVSRSSRTPQSAAPSYSSAPTRSSSPKRVQPSPTVTRSSRSRAPSTQSSYQRKQPKTRNVQQPRSVQPRPQPRSVQQSRSVQRSRPTPSPSASRSSQRSTNRAPKPQRAPKQKKSRSGKKR